MPLIKENRKIVANQLPNNLFGPQTNDYAEILQYYNLEYEAIDYYLQVGEIKKVQGWILHLSVVISQVADLLSLVIPFLIEKNQSFKIIINAATADDLLNGILGYTQIGKLVSIYPETDSIALNLAADLIDLTKSYKGPAIPSDIPLGNIVHARYGSFKPIVKQNAAGNRENYIYDGEGHLVKDRYFIPFRLPRGVNWPFSKLAPPLLPSPKKILHHTYKPLFILKSDPRGNVLKGICLRKPFTIKKCVIKQGLNGMSSDLAGRDMHDRLAWQKTIYEELKDFVPMPACFDLFVEDGASYLALQYIHGRSLLHKLEELNPYSKSWLEFSIKESVKILTYAINITLIIDRLHRKGYVHRDIVPVNFLIDKKDKIWLIDLELMFSSESSQPDPPFKLGTAGFMSPEQQACQWPTVKQDIYSLGASLLLIFTGLTPIKFDIQNRQALRTALTFLIGNKDIAALIVDCLDQVPQRRPAISEISVGLINYEKKLNSPMKEIKKNRHLQTVDPSELKATISSAIIGLSKPPIVALNDLWYSKITALETIGDPRHNKYTKYTGLSEGIGGVLYLIARVHRIGISIAACNERYKKAWEYVEQCYSCQVEDPHNSFTGLYAGPPGLAMALSEGLLTGLIEDTKIKREKIKQFLDVPIDRINLAFGMAGQGIAVLKCREFLTKELYTGLLENIYYKIVTVQQRDGLWAETSVQKKGISHEILDIRYGSIGIIWFLLNYASICSNIEAQKAAERALNGLLKKKKYLKNFHDYVASRTSYENSDGGQGMILTFLKAYEILHDNRYKELAEKALLKFPSTLANTNFTQQNGLAGMGELYLQAWRTLENEEFRYRAEWIATVFMMTCIRGEGNSLHWIMEENSPPTADLMVGNSGIIHFLTRCLNPTDIGYRLLT